MSKEIDYRKYPVGTVSGVAGMKSVLIEAGYDHEYANGRFDGFWLTDISKPAPVGDKRPTVLIEREAVWRLCGLLQAEMEAISRRERDAK